MQRCWDVNSDIVFQKLEEKKILISQYWRLAIGDGESRELEERVAIFPKWSMWYVWAGPRGRLGSDLLSELGLLS